MRDAEHAVNIKIPTTKQRKLTRPEILAGTTDFSPIDTKYFSN